MLADGTYVETVPDGADDLIQAITAAADTALLEPPKSFFENPNLDRPTPMTVTADGRIYGHIAPWNAEHTGMPGVRPPHSPSNYAFFKTGVVATAEGDMVPVGQITLAGGHMNDLTAGAGKAVKHYDDTASAVADINVGEDAHGIWTAGALRPEVTPEQIRALRASAPSGDWRPINGHNELIAICQVNAPGFPVMRTLVASGEMMALIAAGASAMYKIRQEEAVLAAVAEMDKRVTKLEDKMAGQPAELSEGVISSIPSQFVFNVTNTSDTASANTSDTDFDS